MRILSAKNATTAIRQLPSITTGGRADQANQRWANTLSTDSA